MGSILLTVLAGLSLVLSWVGIGYVNHVIYTDGEELDALMGFAGAIGCGGLALILMAVAW